MINAAAESGTNPLVSFLPLILIFAVFYFLMIRPQNKRRREQVQMQASVEPGSRVLTTSGMYATVVEVDDDGLLLEIAPGVEGRFVQQAIMKVMPEDDVLEADDDDDDDIEADEPQDEVTEVVETKTETDVAPKTLTKGAKAAEKPEPAEKASEQPTA